MEPYFVIPRFLFPCLVLRLVLPDVEEWRFGFLIRILRLRGSSPDTRFLIFQLDCDFLDDFGHLRPSTIRLPMQIGHRWTC